MRAMHLDPIITDGLRHLRRFSEGLDDFLDFGGGHALIHLAPGLDDAGGTYEAQMRAWLGVAAGVKLAIVIDEADVVHLRHRLGAGGMNARHDAAPGLDRVVAKQARQIG